MVFQKPYSNLNPTSLGLKFRAAREIHFPQVQSLLLAMAQSPSKTKPPKHDSFASNCQATLRCFLLLKFKFSPTAPTSLSKELQHNPAPIMKALPSLQSMATPMAITILLSPPPIPKPKTTLGGKSNFLKYPQSIRL